MTTTAIPDDPRLDGWQMDPETLEDYECDEAEWLAWFEQLPDALQVRAAKRLRDAAFGYDESGHRGTHRAARGSTRPDRRPDRVVAGRCVMSALVPCPACQMGDHDNHDGSHHGQPGVLGGHICGCRGGCEPQQNPLLDALGDAIARARKARVLPPEGADA